MTLVALYLATMAAFLVLDVAMLTLFMKALFERNIGPMMLEDPNLGVAGIFYLFYVGGILWFCYWPALAQGEGGGGMPPWARAALNGAILGMLAYGTYEWVNMATLKGWTWRMVTIDTLWGGVITGSSAAAGVLAVRALGMAR